MIKSTTYNIDHPALRPFVQYILFNKTYTKNSRTTSFSNNNICVGILKNSKVEMQADGTFTNKPYKGISTYLSGMYLQPHAFVCDQPLDEICIDFTPLGFYHFFSFAQKKYILGEDILNEGFGKTSNEMFEPVFKQKSINERGLLIERLLLRHLKPYKNDFLNACLHFIQTSTDPTIPSMLNFLKCNERKLQRTFQREFDISPKQYLRILRFRNTLRSITSKTPQSLLTDVAYGYGFSDQSHMNKEIRQFTGHSPLQLAQNLQNIDEKVIVVNQ